MLIKKSMDDNHSHINTLTHSHIQNELRAMTDGMAEWVEHRERRRTNALRSLALTAAVAVCVGSASLLMPKQSDTYVSGNLSCCADEACERVNLMIARL